MPECSRKNVNICGLFSVFILSSALAVLPGLFVVEDCQANNFHNLLPGILAIINSFASVFGTAKMWGINFFKKNCDDESLRKDLLRNGKSEKNQCYNSKWVGKSIFMIFSAISCGLYAWFASIDEETSSSNHLPGMIMFNEAFLAALHLLFAVLYDNKSGSGKDPLGQQITPTMT